MRKPGSMWQLLMAMNECGLKNDALMDTFYDIIMERYCARSEYSILVFHDRYDIPAKASDHLPTEAVIHRTSPFIRPMPPIPTVNC